ncbi:O-antigen polysaccharide polymerase Wzy [Serratia fonticola]
MIFIPIFYFIFVLVICVISTIYFKRKTNSLVFAVPLWVMLLWLFKGGVDFSIAHEAGITLRYELELFKVKIDSDYILSLSLYLLYFFGYLIFSFIYVGTLPVSRQNIILPKTEVKYTILIIAALFSLIYIYYAKDVYAQALANDMTAYEFSRFEDSGSKSLINFSSWIAISFSVVGFKYSSGVKKTFFLLLLFFLFVASVPLGNRHILISAVVLYVMLGLDGARYPLRFYIKYLVITFFLLSIISVIYFLREMKDVSSSGVSYDTIVNSIINMTSSSEFTYSHMSMYGILANNIPPNWGWSFYFLVSAFFPQFIGFERVGDIYQYYISHITSNPFKGFSISNPAGWYLNLGTFGVLLGGVLLSAVICVLHRLSFSRRYGFLALLILYFFISDTIGFMRAGGPESFRAVLFIKAFVPALIFYIATRLSFRKN